MSLRTISNDRLIDGAKIDNLPVDTNAELATKQPVGDYATVSQLNTGLSTKQNTLVAGSNISIVGNVISSVGGSGNGNTGAFAYELQTSTPGQTVFNIFEYPIGGNLQVFLNSVKLVNTIDYTETSTTSITLSTPEVGGNHIEFILPNKGINWKGVYFGTTNYKKDDGVSYNGSSYIALSDNIGQVPTNPVYWDILASKGDTGATGPAGANGTNGTNGVDGVDGTDGRGIVSIIRTSGTGAPGTTDTYTITYTDATTSTFDVYNGADGAGGGDVVGPISSTDNALARFDSTTGKIIQNGNITESDNGDLNSINSLSFDTTPSAIPSGEGTISWNSTDKTIDIDQGGGVIQQVGQELYWRGKNQTGSTISNGSVVYANGALGASGIMTIAKYIADGSIPAMYTLGVATEDILNGSDGFITSFGKVRGIDTTGTPYSEVWSDGDVLYASPTISGGFTKVEPTHPQKRIPLAFVIKAHSNGTIAVRVPTPDQEAHDVGISVSGSPVDTKTVQDFIRHSWSTGMTEKGSITTNGVAGTVDISAGDFMVRTGNNPDSPLVSKRIPASLGIACTANDVTYIYYQDSINSYQTTNSLSGFNGIDKVITYAVARNGTRMNVLDATEINVDAGRKNRRKDVEWDNYTYNGFWRSSLAPSSLSGSGLNVLVGAGKYYWFDTPVTHNAFDTSIPGTADANVFKYFYNRTGAWTQIVDSKTINNSQYDNAGTLTSLTTNRWRADDVYVVLCASNPYLAVVLGNAQYTSEALAETSPLPSVLPPQIDGVAVYVGRILVQQGASSFTARHVEGSSIAGASSVSNHNALGNLAWVGSGHTSTANTIATFGTLGETTAISLSPGQSIRLNVGGTGLEAYTPSGLSWGSSVTGTSGTGLTLAVGNSASAGTIAQSITIGNTQTQAVTGISISSGTAAVGHTLINLDSRFGGTTGREGAISVNNFSSATQPIGGGEIYGFNYGTNFATNTTSYSYGIKIRNENNAGTGMNTGIQINNFSTEFDNASLFTGAGLNITQNGVGGTAIGLYGNNNINSSTNGLVSYKLNATQSGATVMQKIDLGTSAQGHTGLQILAAGASTSQRGITINTSSTGTGIPIEFITSGTGRTAMKFSTGFTSATPPTGATTYIPIDIGGTTYKILAQAS